MQPSYSKKKSGVLNEENLVKAINMVREKKKSYFKAATCFNVPKTILFCLCQQNELSCEEAAVTTVRLWPLIESIFCDAIEIDPEQNAVKDNCTTVTATLSTSAFDEGPSVAHLKLLEYSSSFSIHSLDHINMNLSEKSISELESKIECETLPGPSSKRTSGFNNSSEISFSRYETTPDNEISTSRFCYNNSSIAFSCEAHPVPYEKRKILNRAEAAATALIISSSLYKNDLIQKSKKIIERKRKLTHRKSTKKMKNKKKRNQRKSKAVLEGKDEVSFDIVRETDVLIGPGVSDVDAPCMFCRGLFSEDIQGESWIQCQMCKFWAHDDCSGPEFDTWICDYCI